MLEKAFLEGLKTGLTVWKHLSDHFEDKAEFKHSKKRFYTLYFFIAVMLLLLSCRRVGW